MSEFPTLEIFNVEVYFITPLHLDSVIDVYQRNFASLIFFISILLKKIPFIIDNLT